MNCPKCGKKMSDKTGKTEDGIRYGYFHCSKCGEEILDLKQLHSVAEKYREMKKFTVKVSRWGNMLGMRFPKEIEKQYALKNDSQITLIPEKKAIRIIA